MRTTCGAGVTRTALLLVALSLLPAVASAQGAGASAETVVAPSRSQALRLEAAAATDAPAGNWSLGLAMDVLPRLTLVLAAGERVEGQHVRGALSGRFRFFARGAFAADAALGLSFSNGEERGFSVVNSDFSTETSFSRRWSTLYQLSPEAGVTYYPTARIGLRLFGGVAIPLNAPTCEYFDRASGLNLFQSSCQAPQIPDHLRNESQVRPYVGLAVTLGVRPFGPTAASWVTLASPGRWYGWQLLAVDAAALTTGLALAPRDAAVNVWIADVAGVATLHVLHDHPGRAVASIALRTGLTFLGTVAGIATTHHDFDSDPFAGAGTGALSGAILAALIDAAFLAQD